MICTEEVARTKKCPMATSVSQCVASDCLAWEPVDEKEDTGFCGLFNSPSVSHPQKSYLQAKKVKR